MASVSAQGVLASPLLSIEDSDCGARFAVLKIFRPAERTRAGIFARLTLPRCAGKSIPRNRIGHRPAGWSASLEGWRIRWVLPWLPHPADSPCIPWCPRQVRWCVDRRTADCRTAEVLGVFDNRLCFFVPAVVGQSYRPNVASNNAGRSNEEERLTKKTRLWARTFVPA